MKSVLASIIFLCMTVVLNAQDFYVKSVNFPENASIDEKVDLAAKVIPTKAQAEWQKLEMTAFLHFGINTFTDREWGDGTDSPSLFNPTELNAEQWVQTLKNAGFKLVILTAKHHDGFCLWPTATTNYSVASSPWKDGKGDVVRELRNACTKYGMKFGVYLSPWDRNSKYYGTSRYNNFFRSQLIELLTNYGTVDEVWFDGACGEGPDGRKQVYEWDSYEKLIRTLQPRAVIAIMGSDVRWVGNESGLGRETEWTSTVKVPSGYSYAEEENKRLGVNDQSKDLGSRDLLAKAKAVYWHPSEVDVSIRPGWFYHKRENSLVKTLDQLVDIYFKSVGRNSTLLLNIPPDRRGLIAAQDVWVLKKFGEYLKSTFKRDLVRNIENETNKAGQKVIQIRLLKTSNINIIVLQEDFTKGQRVEKFKVEAFVNKGWVNVGNGTTIGYKRILKFPDVKTNRLRLTIEESRGNAILLFPKVYFSSHAPKDENPIEDLTVKNSDIPLNELRPYKMTIDAESLVDDNISSVWSSKKTMFLTLDLGKIRDVAGFTYTPSLKNSVPGTIFRYNVFVSSDGWQWSKIINDGEFSNIKNNPIMQTVYFKKKYKMRYFRLESVMEIGGRHEISAAEVGILLQ